MDFLKQEVKLLRKIAKQADILSSLTGTPANPIANGRVSMALTKLDILLSQYQEEYEKFY